MRIANERPKPRNASEEPKKVAYQPSNSHLCTLIRCFHSVQVTFITKWSTWTILYAPKIHFHHQKDGEDTK